LLSSLWGTLVRGSLPPLLSTLIPVEKPENQLTSTHHLQYKNKVAKRFVYFFNYWYRYLVPWYRKNYTHSISKDLIFRFHLFIFQFLLVFHNSLYSCCHVTIYSQHTHTVCLFFNYAFKKKSLSVGKVEMWNHTFLKECLSDTGTTQSCRDILHALSFRTSVGKEE